MQSTFANGLNVSFKGKGVTPGMPAYVENGGTRTVGGIIAVENINTAYFGNAVFAVSTDPSKFFIGNHAVTIGGSSYLPPLPIEPDVKENIEKILASNEDDIDAAIRLCLYAMKTQVFIDGNKRAAVIFANHYLIAHANGLLVIPETNVPEFKRLLVDYYEGADEAIIMSFLKQKCWKTF